MTVKAILIGLPTFIVMWFGFHGAACRIHVIATEHYWSKGGNPQKYKWSHAYCKVMSAPLRLLIG